MSQAYRIILAATAVWLQIAGFCLAAESASRPADAVTSRPADDPVIVRFGTEDTITESEFDAVTPNLGRVGCEKILLDLTFDKLFNLYLDDHPEIAPDATVTEYVDRWVQRGGGKDKVEAKLAEHGGTWLDVRKRFRREIGRTALVEKGGKLAADKEYVRKLFEADPSAFNGTEVNARHILMTVYPFDTPLAKQTTRERLQKLRQDLLDGKTRWEDAVLLSDAASRQSGGRLGYFTRHGSVPEPIAEAAFKLKVGQISEVIETELGYQIVQVLERREGRRGLDDPATQLDLRVWLEQEQIAKALAEARQRHPVIGVQTPKRILLTPSASRPAVARPSRP